MLRALRSDFNRAARSMRPSCLAFEICWLEIISDCEGIGLKRILSKMLVKNKGYMLWKQMLGVYFDITSKATIFQLI